MKLDSPKWFSENVGELIHGVDVVGLHTPLFQAASDEVELNPDVLASPMENGVLGQCQGRLAVYSELDRLRLLPSSSPSSRVSQSA